MGLAVAAMPGPIIILMIAETLRKGYLAGLSVVLGPITVDALVMIPLAMILQTALVLKPVQIGIGVAGSVFLVFIGYNTIRHAYGEPVKVPDAESSSNGQSIFLSSYRKSLVAHLLNPFGYVFWVTAGSSFIKQAISSVGLVGAVLFPVSFWLGALVIEVIALFFSARGKEVLSSAAYRTVLYACGIILVSFGILLAIRVLF
jgi:threonine/homoserine/homoserine lactone efflux protein